MTKKQKEKNNKHLLLSLFLAVIALVIVICIKTIQPTTEQQTKEITTTYTGIFPCADCSGITTTLTVKKPNQQSQKGIYTSQDVYQGKNAKPFSTTDIWVINKENKPVKNATILTLIPHDSIDITYYLVVNPTTLELLDKQKQIINSPFPLLLYTNGVQKATPSPVGLANPASVNCTKVGGTVTIETRGDGGQYGLCQFENNQACEEWALFRGQCPVGGVKTTGFDNIQQKYCAWLGGKNLAVPNATCTLPNGHVCNDNALYNGTCQ